MTSRMGSRSSAFTTAIIASTCIIRCCYSMARRAIWYVRYCGPFNQGAAAHAVAVLKRVVARMRQVLGSDVRDRTASRQWLCDAGTVRRSVRRKNCSMWWALHRNSRLAATVEPLVEQVSSRL